MLVSSLRVDSVILGHPGEALPQLVRIRAVGSGGEPIPAARVQWTTSGAGAQINESSTQTDPNGYASAIWVLGTRAADSQALAVRVTTGSHSAGAKYRASAVPYVVSHVTLLPTGVQTLRLGDTLGCSLQAEDPFGNKFTPPHPQFVSTDTTLLKVDTLGRVHLRRRGTVQVVGTAATAADTMRVNVIQIVQSIVTTIDTFRFHAIGQVAADSITLMDDRGLEVKDSVPQVRLLDTVQTFKLQIANDGEFADFKYDNHTAARTILGINPGFHFIEEAERQDGLQVALNLLFVERIALTGLHPVKHVFRAKPSVSGDCYVLDDAWLSRLLSKSACGREAERGKAD